MSIIDRILGRTPTEGPQIHAPGKSGRQGCGDHELPVRPRWRRPEPARPADEGLIRVYDQFGRKVEIGRESWRKDVLLPNLAANRDNPDALYDLIVSALNDDFARTCSNPRAISPTHDPQPQRGAMVLGIVLLQLKDFAGARDVLERAIAQARREFLSTGEPRARLCGSRRRDRAQELIWRALELDPNEETSLNWMIGTANAKGGQDAVLAAYARAATLPGSWRALLWLARYALERGDLAEATRLYEEALARASPCPRTC